MFEVSQICTHKRKGLCTRQWLPGVHSEPPPPHKIILHCLWIILPPSASPSIHKLKRERRKIKCSYPTISRPREQRQWKGGGGGGGGGSRKEYVLAAIFLLPFQLRSLATLPSTATVVVEAGGSRWGGEEEEEKEGDFYDTTHTQRQATLFDTILRSSSSSNSNSSSCCCCCWSDR